MHLPLSRGFLDTTLLKRWLGGKDGAESDVSLEPNSEIVRRTICSCSAFPAGTMGYTCSDETQHSITIGLVPSCSKNSFIIAGRSASLVHRNALAPIASESLTKSGLVIRVCEYRFS